MNSEHWHQRNTDMLAERMVGKDSDATTTPFSRRVILKWVVSGFREAIVLQVGLEARQDPAAPANLTL